jgi:uncharacterized protein YhfF
VPLGKRPRYLEEPKMGSPVEQFWNAYLQTLSLAESREKRLLEVVRFGNSEAMANRLADLVVKGIKSATSALV